MSGGQKPTKARLWRLSRVFRPSFRLLSLGLLPCLDGARPIFGTLLLCSGLRV